MTTLITHNLRLQLAEQFYELLDLSANSYLPIEKRTYIYLVTANQLPWNEGVESVPPLIDSTEMHNSLFDHGIVAKRMSIENSSFVVPRINWVSGTIYSQYSDVIDNSGQNFYIKNYKDQVFKCLWNSTGSTSVDEPEIELSSTSLEEPYLLMADGYKWKYLYTISPAERIKFMTEDWMPVHSNKFVSAAAVPGGLDIIKITDSGTKYTNGSSQAIITVNGDGANANLRAVVVNNQVTDIVIQDRGINYTKALLSFNDVGLGTGAAAEAIISPVDGHGFDPLYELDAYSLMFYCDFSGVENVLFPFPVENDYRQVFLLHNPFLYGTETLATDVNYTLYTTVKVSPGLGNFNGDETVFQGTTVDTATFTADVISFDEITNILYLNNLFGTLEDNASLQGNSTGSIRVVNSSTPPTIKFHSGKVLYVSNMLPVTRNADQTDRIRFIMSF